MLLRRCKVRKTALTKFSSESHSDFLAFVDTLIIFPVIQTEFVTLCPTRKMKFTDKYGKVLAFLDTHSTFNFKGQYFISAVR